MRAARRRDFLATALAGSAFRNLPLTSSPDRGSARCCLWQRLRGTGLERFELSRGNGRWLLRGNVVALENGAPAEASYQVVCDAAWRTERAEIAVRDAAGGRSLTLTTEGSRWYANGREAESVQGCIDLDLGWSPSTNTLPIRRLGLAVGRGSGPLRMASVRFPELTLEPLPQEYLRKSERVYRYTSRDGAFVADLEVDDEGLVLDYQGVWRRVVAPGTGTALVEPFLDALWAPGALASQAQRMSLYDPLLGSWAADVIDHDASGPPRTSTGEWHFGWVLEGRAIQDVWISPPRASRRPGMPALGNRYGTSLRVYDPAADVWHVTWINPVTGVRNTLLGRRHGDEIVQEGTDTDGSLMRWTFSDVTPGSFRWRGESSSDGGRTWRLDAEFFGRRVHAGHRGTS